MANELPGTQQVLEGEGRLKGDMDMQQKHCTAIGIAISLAAVLQVKSKEVLTQSSAHEVQGHPPLGAGCLPGEAAALA